jgi:hypothetical protein
MYGENSALAEYSRPNPLIDPVSLAASGVATSRYINLADVLHASIVLQGGIGTSTGCTLTLLQATSTAGAGAKALAFRECWIIADSTSTTLGDIPVRTVGATMTTFIGGKTVIFEIDPSDLDVTNGFNCAALVVTNNDATGGHAVLISAVAMMVQRYEGSNIMKTSR